MNVDSIRIVKIIRPALIAVCVLLGMILLAELNHDYSIPGEPENVDAINPPARIEAMETARPLVAIAAYEDIVNRPLFNEDRQPYVYVAPPPEEKPVKTRERPVPPKPPQQFSLTAIVITPETSLAILQGGKDKSLQRVRLGETIDGWTLTDIQDQSIVLTQGEQTQTLDLEVKGSGKTQKPPVAQKTAEAPPQNAVKIEAEKNQDIKENTEADAE